MAGGSGDGFEGEGGEGRWEGGLSGLVNMLGMLF